MSLKCVNPNCKFCSQGKKGVTVEGGLGKSQSSPSTIAAREARNNLIKVTKHQ